MNTEASERDVGERINTLPPLARDADDHRLAAGECLERLDRASGCGRALLARLSLQAQAVGEVRDHFENRDAGVGVVAIGPPWCAVAHRLREGVDEREPSVVHAR